MRKGLIVLAPVLLAGCVDGSASYIINGNEHALVVRAQQERFWEDLVSLRVIALNLPDCQRQFALGKLPAGGLDVELLANEGGIYTLRAGDRAWRLQADTCGELAPPAQVTGKPLGAFRLIAGKLVFVEAGSTTIAAR
jgi:hypothetical protein